MRGVRFESVDLAFGRHRRSFGLGEAGRPFVVAGANGTGKSSLLEGILRTLFGFNRRGDADRDAHRRREPWDGEGYRGALVLADARGDRFLVEREFDSTTVVLRTIDRAGERVELDGNPAAVNPEAQRFRRWLREHVGVAEIEDYERTAYVAQGALLETRLDEPLLHVAAGGPIDVEEALRRIQDMHRRLTARAIREGQPAASKPRRLERILDETRQVEADLGRATQAVARRAPLVAERRRIESEHAAARAALEAAEAARAPLVERCAIEAESDRLEERIARLEGLAAEWSGAERAVAAAEQEDREARGAGAYPRDFLERAAALEQLWRAEDDAQQTIARERSAVAWSHVDSPAWTAASLAIVAVGVACAILLAPRAIGFALVALGLGLAAVSLRRRARGLGELRRHEGAVAEARRGAVRLRERIATTLDGIPGGTSLSPDSIEIHRRAFERQRRSDGALEGARRDADRLAARVRAELAAAEAPADPGERLRRAVSAARNELATRRLRLEALEAAIAELPADVPRTPSRVDARVAELRAAGDRLLSELSTAERRVHEEGRPQESPTALEEALRVLRDDERRTRESIEVAAEAHSLLHEAHENFRADDQRRLVRSISEHLVALSEGRLGPLSVARDLREVSLAAFSREVPLEYRPLSYGELALALLAVRLGAADFLTRSGVRLPLLVDEPFAHLDERHASTVWSRLCAVATERQVIVATQELRLLERLGVAADLVLP